MMALTAREQNSLGVLSLLVILGVGGYFFAMPQVQAVQAKLQQKTQLDGEVKTLSLEAERMKTNLQDYQVKLDSLRHLNVKSYEPGQLDKGVKAFIDEIVDLGAQTGNEIISLTPYEALQPGQVGPEVAGAQPAATPAAPVTTASANSTTPPADGATPAAADPNAPQPSEAEAAQQAAINQRVDAKPLPLQAAGYTLEVRGGYGQVVQFMSQLKKYPNLLEVESFKLQNEAGPSREEGATAASTAGSHLNPNKPIKLTLKLRLFLMEAGELSLMGDGKGRTPVVNVPPTP